MRSNGNQSIAMLCLLSSVLVLGLGGGASAADLERGKELFDLCAQCHGPDGGGNQLVLAPPIAGLQEWYIAGQLERFKSGVRGTHPSDVGGLRMYPMSVSLKNGEEIADVAAYAATLPARPSEPVLAGGDPARGEKLYVTCGACHGPKADGNLIVNSPSLRNSGDWYLLSALEKYKAGIRGGNPMNINAVLMRGMATQLIDDQAMKDVVSYIMTLRNSQ